MRRAAVSDVGAVDRSDVVAVSVGIGNHRDAGRRSALASAVVVATRKKERRRSARIVGGGSQREPTERRQQAKSLALYHSLAVSSSFLRCSLARFFSLP